MCHARFSGEIPAFYGVFFSDGLQKYGTLTI